MTKEKLNKLIKNIEQINEIPILKEHITLIARKGKINRPYQNIASYKVMKEIVDRRLKEGFEIEIINY